MTNRDKEASTAAACKKKERNPDRHLVRIAVFLCLLGILSGCTPKIYNIDMRYEPTKETPSSATDGRKYALTVASFIDQRKMDDRLLLGRVIKSNGTPIPILPRYVKPTDAVTAALRDALVRSGYAVTPDRPTWDLNEATIRPAWGTILVGGTIDTLDVTCVETLTMARYTATVRVTLIFADVQKKRIFYRLVSESVSSLDHVFFSTARLEDQISSALSDAIDKALEGPETARRIREALKP